MLCPILLLIKEGDEQEVEVEHLVEILHQDEVSVGDVQGDLQNSNLLYLLVSMFLILSGMIEKVMADYRPINILFTGVEGLREEMQLSCRANRIFFKVLY